VCVFSSAKDLTGWKLLDSCLQLLKSMESLELDTEVYDIFGYLRGMVGNID